MNDENELNPPVLDGYTKIPTFKLWVANRFPYMETDFDAITNYDLLGALTDYLNNVIKNEENVESNVAKLNQAYLELFTYVKDYFDNLDVQEEINNKLDEMVEDGTLTQIIGDFIEFSKKSYIIDEIEIEKIYVENNKGDVFISSIPHLDKDGNLLKIKHGYANDNIDTGNEIPTEFSSRNHCTLVSNASVGAVDSQVSAHIKKGELVGLYIHDGEILKDNRQYLTQSFLLNRWILGIKEDNTLVSYIGNEDSNTILNDGVVETCQAFIPLMIDGVNYKSALRNLGVTYWSDTSFVETQDSDCIYDKIYYTLENGNYIGHYHLDEFAAGIQYFDEITRGDQRYQRSIICQDANKNIFFINNNGKGIEENKGLSLNDFFTLAKYYGATFAFVLDGGGSSAIIHNNIMLNNPTDEQSSLSHYTNGLGYSIRKIPDFLYFNKEIKTEYDININNIYKNIQELNKKVKDNELSSQDKFKSTTEFFENENQQHVFNFNQWNPDTEEFERAMQVYFNNTGAYPGGINIADTKNSIEVLRIHNNLSQGIKYLGNKLAYIPDTIPELNEAIDIDNLSSQFYCGLLHSNQDIPNKPFDPSTEYVNIFFLIQLSSGYYKTQIAIGLTTIPKIKIRNRTDGQWKSWKSISIQ